MKRRARAAVEVPVDDAATEADADSDGAEPAEPAGLDELSVGPNIEPPADVDASVDDVDTSVDDVDASVDDVDTSVDDADASVDDVDTEPPADVDAAVEEGSEPDDHDGTEEGGDEAPTRTDPAELRADLADIALAATPLERVRAATRLADRLVECAGHGDIAALSSLLRGHPRREATVWRVHHFRLGDITPSASAAHDDPATAVLGLARSGDGALVAGELIAVDADGSAWTALARTDDELVVQLPSPRTVTGPAAAPDAVGPLLLAWRHALGARSPRPTPIPPPTPIPLEVEADAPGDAAEVESPPVDEEPVGDIAPAPAPTRPTAERQPAADLATALDRLDAPGAPLDRLQAALQADLAARLTAIEARLALAAEEGARIAIARSLDEIREELVRLRDQLSRIEHHLGR